MPVLACAITQTMLPGQARAQDSLPPAVVVNAMLDSTEQVALTCESHDRTFHAVLALSGPGRWWMLTPGAKEPPVGIRYPGVVERMIRIYRKCPDVRGPIIALMTWQAERAAAAAFLEEVAAEEPPPRPIPPPGVAYVWDDNVTTIQNDAVGILLLLGPPGRAALRRLYDKGAVHEPIAKATLEKFASEGFRDPRKR